MSVLRLFILFLLSIAGCVAQPASTQNAVTVPWHYADQPGQIICSDHYRIYTTLNDEQTINLLATLMEKALVQYQQLAPDVVLSRSPMNCYIFARREQWASYTKQQTGALSSIYLKINRGGYTIDDRFVAFYMGDRNTFAVAAHEGWHQFVARNFQTRLPPFLEEGLATLFENVHLTDDQPKWDLSINSVRVGKIRVALENHATWPLAELCRMHAGMVVGLSGQRIETFYAQDWAFAQFLLHAEGGRYRPALRRMMAEMADGSARKWNGLPADAPAGAWNPSSAGPLLEHYLQLPIADIDVRFMRFMHQIAYAEQRTDVRD